MTRNFFHCSPSSFPFIYPGVFNGVHRLPHWVGGGFMDHHQASIYGAKLTNDKQKKKAIASFEVIDRQSNYLA